MSSIQEAMAAAYDAAENDDASTPVSTEVQSTEPEQPSAEPSQESTEARAARARDEAGRFAPKQVEAPTKRAAPTSWKKDYWQDWEKIDPRVQSYLEQREEESRRGVESIKTQYEQVAPLQKVLAPIIPNLQQRGVKVEQWLNDLSTVDRILASGTPQEKQQLIYRMAAANGVQIGSPQQGQGDPQLQFLLQNQRQLEQKVQQFQSWQEQASAAEAQSAINQFAADKPHFEKVKVEMGRLIQNGFATDLQTAYDRAIWSDPEIRQELMAPQAASANRSAEIAKKKAAASSPRSASPTGVATASNGKKSLSETLSEAYDSVVGGRV